MNQILAELWRNRLRVCVALLYAVVLSVLAVRSYTKPATHSFHGSGFVLAAGLLGMTATVLWHKRSLRTVDWVLPAALIILALASFPNTSADYLRYLFDGEMIRNWHLSPYIHLPGEFPLDQYSRIFRNSFWVTTASPYGPLWQALMVGVNFVTGNQLAGGIVALKFIDLIGLLTCAWYLTRISGQAWIGFVFLINPIVLLDTIATPHPDVLIAAAVLGAYYKRNAVSRGVLFGVAGLIKLHALLFAPFIRRNPKDLWATMLSSAVAVLVLLALTKPIVGFEWLIMLHANAGGGVNALDSLLVYNLFPHLPPRTVFMASYALFAVAYGGTFAAFWRGRVSSLTALTITSLLVPLILTGLLEPWHFIIPLAFLLLMQREATYWVVLFLTLVALRSAVRVEELLVLAAIFGACGWLVSKAHRNIVDPPYLFTRLVSALKY